MGAISNFITSVSPWIAGILGGLSANIAANWVWRRYTKPDLQFKKVSEADFEVGPDGSPKARRFKILVKNVGKSAAKNCKPQISLKGRHQNSLYEIDRTVCWAEGNNPSRITINPGETAEFEFFKIAIEEQNEEVLKTSTKFSVKFPSSEPSSKNSNIIQWKYDSGFNRIEGAEFHEDLDKELFESLEWDLNEIVVTSENTDRIDGFVTLQSNVEDTQGLVGFSVSVIPK